jgi:hypothetical protein
MNKKWGINFWKTLQKRRHLPFLVEDEYLGICDENRIQTFVMFPF